MLEAANGKMPVIYLSGPMTELPEFNHPEFNRVTAQLRGMGFTVLNPAENPLPTDEAVRSNDLRFWQHMMRQALRQMLDADVVVLLRGYDTSKGSRLEVAMAMQLGIGCVEWSYEADRGAA